MSTDDRLKTIYEYFSEYTKEQVNEMLEQLTEEEKEYVRLRFGDNLERRTISKLKGSQKRHFYSSVVGKMRTILDSKLSPVELVRKRNFE